MSASALQTAFLEDHRRLIQGLTAIVDAVEAKDWKRAGELAREVDSEAGAHMAFEEEVLYPRIAETRGRAFEDGLVAEHAIGQRAIKALVDLDPSTGMELEQRCSVLDELEVALGHTLSCGTLLSELAPADTDRDAAELALLEAYRRRPQLWSQRRYPRPG